MSLKKILKSFSSFYTKVSLLSKIKHLNISGSGKDNIGLYVFLKDGIKFYGKPTRKKLYKYYSLLIPKYKKIFKVEYLQIIFDIIIRYVERGLKLGGPQKEIFYTPKKGDVVAEMGAYMGYYTLYLSQLVGEKGRIIAIEPMPDNLEFLKNNIEKNNIKNVTIVPKGVWNEAGELTFYKNKDDNQSGSLLLKNNNKDKIEIPVDSLDNILDKARVNDVDFMIIQLNGVEYEALQGLTKIRPKNLAIAARYDKDHIKTSEKIKQLLEQRNYTVTIVKQDYVFAKLNN